MNRVLNVFSRLPERLIREAQVAAPWWNVAKCLATMAIWWIIFFGVLPLLILHIEKFFGLWAWNFSSQSLKTFSGIGFFLLGALGIWSSLSMAIYGDGTLLPIDCVRRLVITGPYRFVRNPMGISAISQGLCVGLWHGSPLVVLYVLCGLAILEIVICPWEERDLQKRFGDEYAKYRAAVRCWIPRRRPYKLTDK